MMRSYITTVLSRSYLYRIVLLLRERPRLAYEVVNLIPDLALRRMGLVLLGWLLRHDGSQSYFVREFLTVASNIDIPASVCQIPALLESKRLINPPLRFSI